jgi:hypothetical protein
MKHNFLIKACYFRASSISNAVCQASYCRMVEGGTASSLNTSCIKVFCYHLVFSLHSSTNNFILLLFGLISHLRTFITAALDICTYIRY